MFTKHSGTKGTIWLRSLCIVFVLAFIQQYAYPLIAKATLLESLNNLTVDPIYSAKHSSEESGSENSLRAVSGQLNLTPVVSNLPNLSNVLTNIGNSAPPTTNQVKDSSSLPPVSTPSAEKTSGHGLLPDLQVITPPISVETPLVNLDVPSVKVEVSSDRIPLVSVNLPAAKVDTSIVQIETPAIKAEVPLTPIPAPQIEVVTPTVLQVKVSVTDIPVPSTSQSNLPLIEGEKAEIGKKEPLIVTDGAQNLHFNTSGNESPTARSFPVNGTVPDAQVKLTPTADQWKDGSVSKSFPCSTIRDPDPPTALRMLKLVLSLPVPTEVNALIEPQMAAKEQTGTSEATPIRTDLASTWFSAPLTLYTGNGSTGGGGSLVTGSSASFGSLGFLFPDILLPLPKIKNQNYEHFRLFSTNQWSKPPPAQPPRFTFFSLVVKQVEKECKSNEIQIHGKDPFEAGAIKGSA